MAYGRGYRRERGVQRAGTEEDRRSPTSCSRSQAGATSNGVTGEAVLGVRGEGDHGRRSLEEWYRGGEVSDVGGGGPRQLS